MAVVEAENGSYHVFFKAKDYTRLEAALKDIGFELDKELGKTTNDLHIQQPGEKHKKLPMKEQIDKAKAKADKINKEQQKQIAKSQNRSRNKPGRAKGGAR